jgi:benzoate-CoA ligase
MFPWAVGATSGALFKDRPSPEKPVRAGRRSTKSTVLTSVPTLINKMLAHDGRESRTSELAAFHVERRRGPAAVTCTSAGNASLRRADHRRHRQRGELSHLHQQQAGQRRANPAAWAGSCPAISARLLDDDGQSGASRATWARYGWGATAPRSTTRAPTRNRKEHLRGGWIVSGDKFRQDADGYWYYEGRGDDLIKSGGIYVSPLEVENCLMQHEAVKECCVIGKKDEAGLEKPFAIVVPNPSGRPAKAGAFGAQATGSANRN